MLSIVLPVFNEEENIGPLLDEFLEFFKKRGIPFEILAVNDGSIDATDKILEKYKSNENIVIVEHEHNKGYGAALRSGFEKSRGDLIFFTDSDRQFDIKEISGFLERIKDYDFIAGFRKKRKDPWFRLFYAWLFSVAARILFGIKVKDIDCAFKLFKNPVIKRMPLSSNGALINLEILSFAKKAGYKFIQLPVEHFSREKGKQTGGSVKVIFRAIGNIFHLWEKTYRQEIRDFFSLIGIALFSIFFTYILSIIAFAVLHNEITSLRNIWLKWDAPHYINIAQNWYRTVGDDAFLIVFFPLYPAVVNFFSTFFKDFFWSSLFVSNLAYIFALIYLFKLVLVDFSKRTAFWAVLFFSFFPTAYFLHAPYTESIFLALVISSFYYARKGKWGFACILTAFATASRLTGLAMLPALLLEYLHQKNFKLKNIKKDILWLLITPLGFFSYLWINVSLYKNAFAFQTIMREHWAKSFSWPWVGIKATYNSFGGQSWAGKFMISGAELFFIFLALLILIIGIRRLRPSYSLFGFSTLFIITSASYLLSSPRYILSIFPIFIVLSFLTGKKEILPVLILSFFTALYMLFLSAFSLGYWTF